ncbi:hypothetical protein predicted by Glimmer/Critica [Salmonella enterica subsp. enterica serovar Weltevreden str. 2007-60-3289-1]|nr:hypothetical protein predicted by Glimmer/Critica [Salmonella enterica subsp. enterica serovar Weltevreden str. 2007-60-3289-1]
MYRTSARYVKMSVDNWRKCRQLAGEIAKADAF